MNASSDISASLRDLLRRHWGHREFRPLQEDIIMSVLEGHDTLGLLPTGGGKSVTFQIPALYMGGLTLVVTPLVSLMKDQVDNLRSRGLGAACMHSAMTYAEMRHAWDMVTNNRNCHFLYVSPERLAGDHFCQQLRMTGKVRMVVVDEAHCISQWGYDFRPSYLNIARLRRFLSSDIRFMALTASATPAVVKDICRLLQFREAKVLRRSFSRPNISYVVRRTEDKMSMILRILHGVPGSSIVYVRSRKLTVELADHLRQEGVSAAPFHAGMPYEVKEKTQQDWKKGLVRVIVATNAFGMGIDKPDVRSVIHYAMPSSLEEYYQEAGRAGRDGLPSYAVGLVGKRDKSLLRRRIAETFPPKERIAKVYELLCNFLNIALEEGANRLYSFDNEEFCRIFGLQERQVLACLGLLAGAGYLEYIDETDSSSRVMIVCEREELYGFDDSSLPGSDRLLEYLLRNYPGLFSDYVPVSESRMAAALGLDKVRVHELLVALSRAHIVSYIPPRTVPCIYMMADREEPQYLMIPRTVYEERRAALEKRIDSVIAFCGDTGNCRQNRILSYFGEDKRADCGICDCCRNKKHPPGSTVSDGELTDALLSMLRQYPSGIPCSRLLDLHPACRERIKQIISDLQDEGFLTADVNNYISLS